MTTPHDDKLPGLDELSQQLTAGIERDRPYVTEQLAGVMEELQQLIDAEPPLDMP